MPRGNRQNARRHRRREERRLPRRRRGFENRVEILGESHVEHFVRFVEDEHAKGVELQRSPPNVIERAARRRHDDLRSALELADLPVHRRSAVHRQHRQPNTLRVLVNRLGHLHRQLARGPGEFVILLPEQAIDTANLAGARLRLAVEQAVPPGTSVSVGMVTTAGATTRRGCSSSRGRRCGARRRPATSRGPRRAAALCG